MPDLRNLFEEIRKNPKDFLRSEKGDQFEQRIMVGLDRAGFNRVIADDIEAQQAADLRNWASSRSAFQVENPLQFQSHYWHHPCGKQNYPDILVFANRSLFCLEPKFSAGGNAKPMWNSGLPRQDGISDILTSPRIRSK